MPTLNQTLEEFDEKFNFLYCMENVENDIKAFISQSIKTALESVVMEERSEILEGNMNDAWNACRDEVIKKKDEFLNN